MVDQQGDPLLNSLVAAYLAKVAPKVGASFQKTVKGGVAPGVTVGLKEVVQHFSNTAPPQKRAGLGSGGGPPAKKKKSDTEDSEEDSSDDDSSDSEAPKKTVPTPAPAKKVVEVTGSKKAEKESS